MENRTPPNAVPKLELTPAALAHAKISNLLPSFNRILSNIFQCKILSAIAQLREKNL